ncbi:MAG: hypothetical protein FJ220_01685, partial [Kiritimatiellaceae bacterium]|nr:hypothetical protein [Kiritimatiellaceae bacterium]
AGEHKIGKATLRVGASDYYYYNADQYGSVAGLTTSANTPGTEFNLVEGFSTLSFTLGIPVALNGQYVVNTDAATSEDTAYLFGTTLGKAKDKGSWEAGYNYRDTEKDAVPDGYNDSDFAHGVAGSKGHSFWTKYQLAKNLQACATYLLAKDNKDEDSDLIQLDLNFKF